MGGRDTNTLQQGERDTNKLFILQQGQWHEYSPPMNIKCSSPAVVSTPDGNYILVIGGKVTVSSWTTAVELLDVRSRTWYELIKLPQAIIRPTATICGNQIYVIGYYGDVYSCSLQPILSSNISDSELISLTWTQLYQQPAQKWSTAATLNGQLIMVGGEQGGSPVNSIHQLIAGQWV